MPLGVVPNLNNQISFTSYRKGEDGKWSNAPAAAPAPASAAAAPAPAPAARAPPAAAPAPAVSELELAYSQRLARAKLEHERLVTAAVAPSAESPCRAPAPGAESPSSLASNVTARRLARAQTRSPRRQPSRDREKLQELLSGKCGAVGESSTGLERLLKVGEYCEQVGGERCGWRALWARALRRPVRWLRRPVRWLRRPVRWAFSGWPSALLCADEPAWLPRWVG